VSSLVKGSLLIVIGTIYRIIASLLIDKYLAINLGVESYGKYKYGITIVLILSTICSLGFVSSIVRTVAIQKGDYLKKKIITISLFLVLIFSIIVIFVITSGLLKINIDKYFQLASLFYALNTLYVGIYSGMEKPKYKVFINDFLGFTLYLLFLFAYFSLNINNEHIALVYLAYTFFVFIVNVLSSRNLYVKLKKEDIKIQEVKSFFKYSFPLFWVSVLIILNNHVDKLILNYFVSEKDLGIYFAVFNISNLLPLILTILLFLYLPKVSKFIEEGKFKKVILINSYSSKWTMIIASVFFGIILYHSKSLLMLLYSVEFVQGDFILKVLAFGQWINVSLGFTGQNLLAYGDSKSQLYIRLASFILSSLLLFFGVKYLGNLGAAIAILFVLLFSNIAQIAVLRIKHNFIGYKSQNIYAVIIVIIIGFMLFFMHKLEIFQRINFIVLIIIDIVIFISLLIFTKVLNKKDVKILKVIG